MRCPYCQKENPDRAKFCTGCGRKLEIVHQLEADAKNQQIPDMRNPQVTEKKPSAGGTKPSNQKPKKKKKKAVVILALLLIVVLVVSLFSCGGSSEVEVYEEEEEESSEEIVEETEEVTYERDESLITADAGNMQLLDLTSYDLTAADSEEALAVIGDLTSILNIDDTSELTLKNEYSVNGSTYYRFQQTYQGLTVFGRSIVLSADADGNVQLITEDLADVSSAAAEAVIDEETAISSAEAYLAEDAEESEADATDTDTEESTYASMLCYYAPSGSDTAVLAYAITAGTSIVFIDAQYGTVLGESSELYEITDELTGQNGTLTVNVTDNEDGTYSLVDEERGISVYSITIQTHPFDEGLAFYPESYSSFVSLVTYTDDTDRASAVDALYNTEITYDFYETLFGHTSTDGNGSASIYIFETVQYVEISSGRNGEIKEYLNNAFSCGNGTDISCIAICPTTYDTTYADELDIIAHEYTHQVISFTCGVENSSLNEGLSDIMGELVQGWSTGTMDWIMGADIGDGDYIRNIISPDGDDLSSYEDYTDSTEGHNGSTILSHAAYLMWAGSNEDSIEAIDDVETLAELWYRTMLLMTSDATFTDCRVACEAAAAQMFSLGLLTEAQISTVVWAFDEVGIAYRNSVVSDDDIISFTVFDGDGNRTEDFVMTITNAMTGDVVVYDGADIGSPYYFSLEEGWYGVTISPVEGDYPSVSTLIVSSSSGLADVVLDAINADETTHISIYTTFGTSISGAVLDNIAQPIEGVTVTANAAEIGEDVTSSLSSEVKELIALMQGTTYHEYSAVTDSDGSFSMDLPVGIYQVTYEMEGYDSVTVTQVVSTGTNQADTVVMTESGVDEYDELELYAEILDMFYYGISSQWAYYEEKDIYWYGIESESDHSGSSSTICYMWYQYAEDEDLSLSEAGYAFFDLDGDGICELLIDTCNEDGSHGSGIRDIYTYRDGEIVHLASVSERSDLHLCTDGSIEYQGTTGSGEGGASIYNYYGLDTDSNYLVIRDSLTYIYDEDEYYYSDSAAYTEDEDDVTSHAIAEAIMDSYEALDYELTPFSEYEPTTEMETTASVDWASVYLDFLENEVTITDEQWLDYDEIYAYAYEYYEGYEGDSYYGGFSLIYVNDDDIPELVMYGTSEATGMLIFTIGENGDIDVMMSERLNSFYYAEDLNLLVNHAGVTGVSWDVVYTITDGTWVQLASGSYEYYDTDGDGILSYYWNGEEVTEEEYEDNLDQYIMSLTLTYPGTDPEYTLDELISWLEAQ